MTIAVVGGGIVGSAIAYELARRGAPAILVDRADGATDATAGSFASISAMDEPDRDLYLLKTAGMAGWRRWGRTMDDLGVGWHGEVRWAETSAGGRALAALVARAARRGYPVRSVTRATVRRLLPGAVLEGFTAASVSPEDGQADPGRAVDALRAAFVSAGGQLVLGDATVDPRENAVALTVDGRIVPVESLVLATGAEAAPFLARLGWEVPAEPSPGLLVTTTPVPPFVEGSVYVMPARGIPVHLRQRPDGRVLVGQGEQTTVARDTSPAHARDLLRAARRSFPALAAARVERAVVAWRPMPRDRVPIVGPVPGWPGVYVAITPSGVTVAPALAAAAAGELTGDGPHEALEPFRPARFATRRAEMAAAVEEVFTTTD